MKQTTTKIFPRRWRSAIDVRRPLAWLGLAAAVIAATPAPAQNKKEAAGPAPRVIIAMPMAVEMGKTTRLTLRGQHLETVAGIQVQEPKSTGKIVGGGKKVAVPNQMNAEQVGDSEIEIEITLPAEVPGGVIPFSAINARGEKSKPHLLIVHHGAPVVVEKEPNDGFKQAQAITIPCVIEGSIRQSQDVDVFRFDGKQGDHVVFDLQANRFGSPLDGMLTLFDAEGRVIATADDSLGSLDPVLDATLPRAGTYYVSLIDANDQGGSMFIYRLVAQISK